MTILVAGGEADPNLRTLIDALGRRGVASVALLVGASAHPWITWDMDDDALVVNGERITPRAVFLRHDVFAELADKRAETAARSYAWFTAIAGYALAHERVALLNRRARPVNKLEALAIAKRSGLFVPHTVVTNHRAWLISAMERGAHVAKPAGGGGLCVRLADTLSAAPDRGGALASPAIVQPELVPPEVRVYRVGGKTLGFEVRSPALDYRAGPAEVVPLDAVPDAITVGLTKVMSAFGLDFAAADFKHDPATGELLFLEINTAPMFAAFDAVAGGALSALILEALSV